jgi:hypothetical protein
MSWSAVTASASAGGWPPLFAWACGARVGGGGGPPPPPAVGSDPAVFVRGGPEPGRRLQGDPAADTDAA